MQEGGLQKHVNKKVGTVVVCPPKPVVTFVLTWCVIHPESSDCGRAGCQPQAGPSVWTAL